MAITTKSAFDICQLRKAIAQALRLPENAVISGWLPENPLSAFITVDLISQQEIGQARRVFKGEAETEIITSSLMSNVAISCYGNNGLAMASKLKTALQSTALLEALHAMNAAIVRFSDVRNLTATVGADYQERGQFDCTISHHHILEAPLKRIEEVAIIGAINGEITKPPNFV